MKNVVISGEFPELETERLRLRKITLDDTEAVFAHFADPDVTRYLDIPCLDNMEQAEKIVLYMLALFERREGVRWGISLKESEQLIGTCGFDRITRLRGSRGEIKYDLMRAHWGKGLMAEAVAEVVRFGFETLRLYRIEALVVPDAERSLALLTRMGFTEEGTRRGYGFWKGRYWDENCFSLLRGDWAAGPKAAGS